MVYQLERRQMLLDARRIVLDMGTILYPARGYYWSCDLDLKQEYISKHIVWF